MQFVKKSTTKLHLQFKVYIFILLYTLVQIYVWLNHNHHGQEGLDFVINIFFLKMFGLLFLP